LAFWPWPVFSDLFREIWGLFQRKRNSEMKWNPASFRAKFISFWSIENSCEIRTYFTEIPRILPSISEKPCLLVTKSSPPRGGGSENRSPSGAQKNMREHRERRERSRIFRSRCGLHLVNSIAISFIHRFILIDYRFPSILEELP